MSIADLRREYRLAGLRRTDLDPDPIVQFKKWLAQATGARASGRVLKFLTRTYKSLLLATGTETLDVTAMTLATADREGRPSARVVLLKGVDGRGFIFFTNYESRKGLELAENPNASLVFYWPDLERQICVAGQAEKLPAAESDAYFQSRPRGSKLASWASSQSRPVRDRAALEDQWRQYERQFPGEQVPRPSGWGGYLLRPSRIEFWQGRPNRLHDRFCYTKQPEGSWQVERLCP